MFAIAPASKVRPSARATGAAVADSPTPSISAAAHARSFLLLACAAGRRLNAASIDTMPLGQNTRKKDNSNHTNLTVTFSNSDVTIRYRGLLAWIRPASG